jgi:GTP-binding protein EngB required for normal cell division
VFIGNPGVGKSTFLNGFFREVKFQSGVALAKGLTTTCQRFDDGKGTVYIDTPGLSDVKLREQAAVEIKSALTVGGLFKIFFVITLEDGRLRPDDKTTMILVLNAAPEIGSNYSIIINKLQPEIIDMLDDKDQREEFLTLLNENLPPTSAIFFNIYDQKLSAKKNVLPELCNSFFSFILTAPLIFIDPKKVNDILSDQFLEMKKFLTEHLEKLQRDNEEMRSAILRQQQKYIEVIFKREDELRNSFEKQIDENKEKT